MRTSNRGPSSDTWLPEIVWAACTLGSDLPTPAGVIPRSPPKRAATLHLLTRGRAILGIGPASARATKPTVWTGHHPRIVELGWGARHPRLTLLPSAQRGTGYQDLIPQILDEQAVLSHTSNVPLSLLKNACLQGTPDEIVALIAEWCDHGLSYPVLPNLSTLQPSLRRGLAAGNPFAKALGGIRKLWHSLRRGQIPDQTQCCPPSSHLGCMFCAHGGGGGGGGTSTGA